ncbi:uncharacterized protein LOC126785654 [Argentina anserina]|uniref:uncharacterized protein LOC126785654 n=1 Tax=Argentina anserina TaxID=57926 RepID=UPI00217662AC|nr:uncharacterized protein LOC126785654 [Potentilla anserina]
METKSRVWPLPLSPTSPPQTHKSQLTPLLFFFFFLINLTPTFSLPNPIPNLDQLYSHHCNDVVPKSETHPKWFLTTLSIQDIGFHTTFFTGGHRFFLNSTSGDRKALIFRPNYVAKTLADGIFQVRGSMDLRSLRFSPRRNLKLVTVREPRIPVRRGVVRVALDGFYSESAKKLCMIGRVRPMFNNNAGKFEPSVVVKLNYPKWSSVYDSLISGSLESVVNDKDNDESYFDPVMMLAFSVKHSYVYTFVGEDRLSRFPSSAESEESIGLRNFNDSNGGLCRLLGNRLERFELVYGGECRGGGVNCNPVVGGEAGFVPGSVVFYGTRCTEGRKMQILLGFLNSTGDEYLRFPFVPSRTMIAEGEWDEKGKRLCAVACRILNFTESLTSAFVGDCSTKLSLRFPVKLSLRNRSALVGQIWSDKKVSDAGYFSKIEFQGLSGWLVKLLRYKYEYSANDNLRKACAEKRTRRGKGTKYPDEYSLDMKFDMRVSNSKGKVAWGFSSPLFVDDDRIYGRRFWDKGQDTEVPSHQKKSHSSPMNISYKLSFTRGAQFFHDVFPSKADVAAEGIYDRDYGNLCMMGCRHASSEEQNLIRKDMLDCSVQIDVHFPPLNSKDGQNVKGSIESTRNKSDPLYFERIDFSSTSIYHNQAAASITRIDIEIIMVLISNTLICAFVGWQLYFVKKNPDVLPFTSLVMLTVLTLGYVIPLLFTFEAMLAPNQRRQSTFLGVGGWLQVNEVMVRLIMLVAFILHLLLLQGTLSSRQGVDYQKSLMDSERKVLYVTLTLYIAGALITCSVHQWMNTHQNSHRPFHRNLRLVTNLWHLVHPQRSLLDDIKSYAGFILDGFLLPQILLNVFANSGERSLSCSFYFGTTMIRLLPHAYDLYRARTYTRLLAFSYIYANLKTDFFSTAWNIVIPCCVLLFAAIMFMQQRFGGRCILPKIFRHSTVYEKVPVISNEEL